MKTTLTFLALLTVLSTSAFAAIVTSKGEYFVETKSGKQPIMSVNEMIQKNTISNIKIYGNGRANLISFSEKKGPVMLYSVDEKGFVYSIKPFNGYTVTEVDANGKFKFSEVPNRQYVVDAKGYFFY